jgi:hypothetical protein
MRQKSKGGTRMIVDLIIAVIIALGLVTMKYILDKKMEGLS